MNVYYNERRKLINNIKYVKSLLNLGFNEFSYTDMTTPQLYCILNKYKKKFNDSNINLFYIKVTLYNKDENKGLIGNITKNNGVNLNLYNLKTFKSKDEANDYYIDKNLKNFEDYSIIKRQVVQLYF